MTDNGSAGGRYSLEIVPGSRIALFHWNGPITLEDRRTNVRRMVQFCQTHGVHSLIIDGRDQLSETDTMESFEFGNEVPVSMRGLRIAVVYRADDESLPFIETVAYNRGATTKGFVNFLEARSWLESFDDPDAAEQQPENHSD